MTTAQSARRPTALVTGASQGIGAGVAIELARQGHDVAVTSTRLEKLSPVLDGIRAAGGRALPVQLDIREQPGIDAAMASVVAEFGGVDVLVNNAAAALRKPALETSPDEWNQVLATNLTGTFFMTQAMGRHLIAGGRGGSVICITSTHGLVGMAGRATYGITKAGIIHLCKMLAVEWAAHNIRVNSVAPGAVITPSRQGMAKAADHDQIRMARIPMKKLCTVEDVAAAVAYLASPQAAYVTGQTLVLDGGVTAQ